MKKRKRSMAAALALCMAFCLAASPAWMWELKAEASTYGDFTYEVLQDGTIGITGYAGAEVGSNKEPDKVTVVEVPAKINGTDVTSISSDAFLNKRDITEITIPTGVTKLGSSDSSICGNCPKLIAIHVADENTVFSSESGALFNKDKTELLRYPGGKNGAYTVPDSVTSIARHAAYLSYGLTEITIPNSVTSIGYGAFAVCDKLTDAKLSTGLQKIEGGVFQGCNSLERISIPSGVTSIGQVCFEGCTKLAEVSIPDSVTSIENAAFYNCSSLKKVYYSGTKEQWDQIRIGTSGVTGAGSDVNTNGPLVNAEFVYSSDGSTDLDGQEEYYEYREIDGTIEITGYTGPAQPLTIPSKIDGKDVTSIGEYAFNGCAGLTEVMIPSGVTTIKPYAFYSSSVTRVEIPSSVVNIGQFAFRDCGALERIDVDAGNAAYASVEGALYNRDQTLFICCPAGKSGAYEVVSSVKTIDDYAFYGCRNLTGVTIPSGVVRIQESAFRGCSSLAGIALPSGLSDIGAFAFAGCSGLEKITVPSSVAGIGISAFSDCTGLKEADIPFGINRIEKGVFRGCSGLEKITVPSSVTDIGQEAFYGCTSLASVTVPTSLALVQKSAFGKCTGLRDVYYSGSEEQWNKISVSMEGGSGENNQPLLDAAVHLDNGTTINGPDKDADYKIGTVSAYSQAGKTVRISGQIYAVAGGVDYSSLDALISSRERVIATFQDGKVIRIESLKKIFRCEISVRESSKPPITLQNGGYLEDTQDIQVRLEAVSDYPESVFQGVEDIGVPVGEMTVSVRGEGFCIRRMDADRDETTDSLKEAVNKTLSPGSAVEYIYAVYAREGFSFTEKELPYEILASAETENGTANGSVTLYALFENTKQEINTADAKQELERLKSGDPFSLEKDFQHYLSQEQMDVLESYLYTWLAEADYAYRYSGGSGVKERIMKKSGIDPLGDFASGTEQAITHVCVETIYGRKTFEITIGIGNADSGGNLYPAYGEMHYEVLEKGGIPSDVPKSGKIGKDSYADMGPFAESVKKASEDSLHSTWQWQKLEDEKASAILVDRTVSEIVGNKNGSFTDATFTIYAKPLLTYSKIVKVSCPVDVHVYSMDGKEAGSIVNNSPRGGNKNVRLDVDGDTKTVYLAGDDYYVNLRGTDNGTMKYEVEEIANEEVCRSVQFLELQLKKDLQYEGYVFRPLNIDRDLYALRTTGSSGQEVIYPDKDTYEYLFKKVQQLSLSQKNTALESSRTVQLSASHLPLDASNPDLRWTTDNASVAKVDENGLVTAVGKGKATVTVSTKDGSFLKQFCVIDVSEKSDGSGGSSGGSSSGGWSGGYGVPVEQLPATNPPVVKVHYVLQFDLNGGTKTSRRTMTLLSGDLPGIMPKAQRKDYVFDGWYTQAEGGTKVSGDKPLEEAATLYARWTKAAAPAKPASLALQSKKKGQIQAGFQTVDGAAGYQVDYSVNKSFTSVKTKEAGKAAKAKTITGLKAGKKYYIRVRAYRLDSMGNRIYGPYSAVKSIVVKK